MPGFGYDGSLPAPFVAQAMFNFTPEQNFTGLQVAPALFVTEKKGTVPLFKRSDLMPTAATDERQPGAAFNRGRARITGTEYECVGYGREFPIPVETQARYASIMDAQLAAGRIVKGQLVAGHEIRVKTLAMNTTTFAAGNGNYVDLSAAPWDTAGSDVISNVGAQIEAFRAQCGMLPNALIVPRSQVVNLCYKNTAIRALLSGLVIASPAAVRQNLAAILGVDRIIAPESIYNAGNEVDTNPTITDVYADDYAMLARIATTSDPAEPCLARTVVWSAMGAGTDGEYGTYFEPQTKQNVVQGTMYTDEIIVDSMLGRLLKIDA